MIIDLCKKRTLKNTINKLRRYNERLQSRISIFVDKLAIKGLEISIKYINEYQLPFDKCYLVKNNVTFYGNKAYISIQSVNEDATYYEFGTGIIGMETPHPTPWAYDVNEHGELGWVYINEDGNKIWTQGLPSSPYTYRTYNDLYKYIYEVAKEVFNDKLA